ncbi:hypothetical protein MLD38_016981 [Melastoma candidum]|uniref:Uncharacterized protein n=1 Tax=Melastoma candidum TaxID=119954 RepID=A0ACB9QQC5_9MYRT|nr:hypothetical protein MLD38_016981 [Melastoma candidum]
MLSLLPGSPRPNHFPHPPRARFPPPECRWFLPPLHQRRGRWRESALVRCQGCPGRQPHLDCVIYTGDHDASPDSLLHRAQDRFGIKLLFPPEVVFLHRRKRIEDTNYPRFTRIGQSFGSVFLSWEALSQFTPNFYFDTSGYAFTYPIARLFRCKVICYTHYPTISLDMLSRVRQRSSMYNNKASIAQSAWLSRCKLLYYNLFSWIYGLLGSFTHLSMVNSSWTNSHVKKQWKISDRIKRVYPSCDTSGLQVLPLESSSTNPIFISVAQFRPEKAQVVQLEAFALACRMLDRDMKRPKLQFVGSCRNNSDEDRLESLKKKAMQLNIAGDVEFYKNIAYRDLIGLLGGVVAGFYSMIDEHFGISVVEYIAAGAIPIGPKMDIVLEEDGQPTGFLAETVEEYANAIIGVICLPEDERLKMVAAARKPAGRFSEQRSYDNLKAAIWPIMQHQSR